MYGFTDAYILCDECHTIIPLNDIHYVETFIRDDNSDDVVCDSCIHENPSWFINNYILADPKERINHTLSDTTLETLGFNQVRELGYDDIDIVYKELKTDKNQVIFSDTNYKLEVWVKN